MCDYHWPALNFVKTAPCHFTPCHFTAMSLWRGGLCWSSMSELIRDRVTRVTRCTCFRIALLKPWLTLRLPEATRSGGTCPNSKAWWAPVLKLKALRIGPDRILCSGLSSRFLEPSKRKECSPETPGYLGLNFFITYHRKQLGSKAPSTYSIPARLSNCFRTCIQGPERTRGCRKSHQFVQ